MLYENIFLDSADSAYVSKEIPVMSPNQEKRSLSAISQHDTSNAVLLSKMMSGKHYCQAHKFTEHVSTYGVNNIRNSR